MTELKKNLDRDCNQPMQNQREKDDLTGNKLKNK